MNDPVSDLILGPSAITTLTKLVTDALRKAFPAMSGAWTLLAAFIASLVGAFLVLMIRGGLWSQVTVATAIIQAILATGAAVGVTELQNSTNSERQKSASKLR
jgi:hypothetical protein